MKTYLVIEAVNVVGFIGNVAYLEVITPNDNILKFEKRDPTIRSISAFKTMKAANEQINFLNDLYRKERNK